jgi:alpha-galactosidase
VASPPPSSTSTYLSDLVPVVSYSAWGPVERDQSTGDQAAGDGRTLTLNGTTYAKGLGVHAYSDVRFTVTGCTRFRAAVGVDDEVGSNGSVIFRVYTDWAPRFDSGVMTGDSPTKMIDIPLAGVDTLQLIAHEAGDGIASDHADWADARVDCGGQSANIVYLGDTSWISAISGWGPVERNLSNGDLAAGDGRTLTLNGTTYAKGLGVHPYSDVRFVATGCTRFQTAVGVDDEAGSSGSVVFSVFTDGVQRFTSGLMTGASPTQQVDIPLAGVTTLQLIVTDGGDGMYYDHADWADARLECKAG